MTLEDDALRIAIDPAASAWFDDNEDGCDPDTEWHNYLRDITKPDRPVTLLLIPAIKALIEAGMIVDNVALKAIHFPIEGYVACPHSAIGERCPEDNDKGCIEYTAPGRNHSESVVKRLICAHCLIGSAGSDRPHWLTDDDAGYYDHPVPDRGYADDMEHRVWPCPTAIALGLT